MQTVEQFISIDLNSTELQKEIGSDYKGCSSNQTTVLPFPVEIAHRTVFAMLTPKGSNHGKQDEALKNQENLRFLTNKVSIIH